MSKQTADDLRAARKLIEMPDHWQKGDDFADNCYCAATAICRGYDTNHDHARYTECRDALCRAIGLKTGAAPPIWGWNDAPERAHAEVLAAFDKAIAAEESTP